MNMWANTRQTSRRLPSGILPSNSASEVFQLLANSSTVSMTKSAEAVPASSNTPHTPAIAGTMVLFILGTSVSSREIEDRNEIQGPAVAQLVASLNSIPNIPRSPVESRCKSGCFRHRYSVRRGDRRHPRPADPPRRARQLGPVSVTLLSRRDTRQAPRIAGSGCGLVGIECQSASALCPLFQDRTTDFVR